MGIHTACPLTLFGSWSNVLQEVSTKNEELRFRVLCPLAAVGGVIGRVSVHIALLIKIDECATFTTTNCV